MGMIIPAWADTIATTAAEERAHSASLEIAILDRARELRVVRRTRERVLEVIITMITG